MERKLNTVLKKRRIPHAKEELKDLGFSTKATSRQRAINKDGSFNVTRKSPFLRTFSDTFTEVITMPWWKFNCLVMAYYLFANIVFTCVYMFFGFENIRGIESADSHSKFWEAFFFSTQTLTTVGFGYMSPKGFAANIVAAFEAMVGLLGFALATGVLYGRFSRPSAQVIYSDNLLIAPYKEGQALMFKIANARKNELIEVEIEVVMAINVSEGNQSNRRFYNLELERKRINFFPLTWTIVHPLDDNSPIKDLTVADFEDGDAEIFIYLKAFDDTYAQTVHSRYSYMTTEIVSNAKFVNIMEQTANGTIIELDRINEHVLVGD